MGLERGASVKSNLLEPLALELTQVDHRQSARAPADHRLGELGICMGTVVEGGFNNSTSSKLN